MSYQPKTYRKQGGDEFVVADGGKITVEDGGAIHVVGALSAESTIEIGDAGAAQTVTITAKDKDGTTIAGVRRVEVYMATDAAGATPSTAGVDVGVTATTGKIVSALTAKLHLVAVTDAAGVLVLSFDHTGGGAADYTDRPVLVVPDGSVVVGGRDVGWVGVSDMSYAERHDIEVTTDESGDATAYSPVVTGRLLAIHYVKDGTAPFADGVDVDATAEATGEELWDEDDVNASKAVYPRVGVHDTTGTAATFDGTEPVVDTIALANDRVKVVVANGGDTKSGRFIVVTG